MEVIELDVYFDYNCPFVYRAAKMLEAVEGSGRRALKANWRFFSLSQVNHRSDDPHDAWAVWTAPDSEPVKGRLAFKAAEAARRQDRFEAFHVALLDARHRDRLDIEDRDVVDGVAAAAGLDLERFHRDLADPRILDRLERDHAEARDVHGVFGTPTLAFSGGAAYLRLGRILDGPDAVRVFDSVAGTIAGEPDILEMKRPVRNAAG